ncbi:hypothetical protein DL93DRAFT_2164995 [Clavulina sp. PMI_390]|nr:hypothetical protein DL93DRAFT_2164995 [Clavulina sp. PMI_390]
MRRRIGEQESKAIQHVFQLGLLAHKLNRTLVLPPMWKSRFGTCYRNPFEFYYQEEAFRYHDIPFISFEAFQEWTSQRATRPTGRAFHILSPAISDNELTTLQLTNYSAAFYGTPKLLRNTCLLEKTPRLQLDESLSTIIQPFDPKWYIKPGAALGLSHDIIALFAKESREVLTVTWELRYPVLPVPPGLHVEYSLRWIDLAQVIASSISPFIAVHWRMETVPVEHMPACASGLVSSIQSLEHAGSSRTSHGADKIVFEISPAATVYLATDYPLRSPGALAHSGTFKHVSELHHVAMRLLEAAFKDGGPLFGHKLTSLADELGRQDSGSLISYDESDPGLRAILDKLVAIRADWFLGGMKDCSRQSSFTDQIISTRSRVIQEHEQQKYYSLKNIVDYFSRVEL